MVKHSGAAAQKASRSRHSTLVQIRAVFLCQSESCCYVLKPPLFIVDFNITVTNQVAFDLVIKIKIPCFLGS